MSGFNSSLLFLLHKLWAREQWDEGQRHGCVLDLAGLCVQCGGAGDLVNVCNEEPLKGFSRKLTSLRSV